MNCSTLEGKSDTANAMYEASLGTGLEKSYTMRYVRDNWENLSAFLMIWNDY